MSSYDVGDVVRLTATFAVDGTPVDPDEVRFIYKVPDGEPATLSFGTDLDLQSDETGTYYVDLIVDVDGLFHYRWEAEGEGQSAEAGSFFVRRNLLDTLLV